MEITHQNMEELFRIGIKQQAQSTQQKQSTSPEQFGDILQNALTAREASGNSVSENILDPRAQHADMISKMLLQPFSNSSPEEEAFTNASGTLDLWDSYTKALGSPYGENSLREAYAILEDIGTQISQLKANAATLQPKNANLKSLINELDVMATTERVKFNRGDYA